MALHPSSLLTADDIWQTPDDGNRYEIIDGELYVSPPPVTEHQSASGGLHWRIAAFLDEHPIGKVWAAPIGVKLDTGTGVQPDLVYVSQERLRIVSARGIEGAPDLVVEILSPSTRRLDLGVKLRRYQAAGIPHYWVVDPRRRTITTYSLVDGTYELTGSHGPGSIFRPALFPGLAIPVDTLWG